jgi:hypothetical protein
MSRCSRDVEVHCMYTPYGLMIVPAASALIADARSVHGSRCRSIA